MRERSVRPEGATEGGTPDQLRDVLLSGASGGGTDRPWIIIHRGACGGLRKRMSGDNPPHGPAWPSKVSVNTIQCNEVTGSEGGDEQQCEEHPMTAPGAGL